APHAGTPFEATAHGLIHRPEIPDPQRGHRDAVAVIRPSGSTGTPKQTLLTASALTASANATAERIGGQGQWLLAVGTQYVAGLAVVSRSVQAETLPEVIDPGFSPEDFIAATHRLDRKSTRL